MQRFILSGLSALVLSTAATPAVKADTFQANPFQVVGLAWQGYLEPQGIPAGASLLNAYDAGQITARDVVQAAVNDNRVDASALTDRGFLAAVNANLQSFSDQGDS